MKIQDIIKLVRFLEDGETEGATKKSDAAHPYQIGQNYFIRTVTHHYTGKLVAVFDGELVLQDVAWIADSGRFADALKHGALLEVEPLPKGDVVIGRGAIVDASIWNHGLPTTQK